MSDGKCDHVLDFEETHCVNCLKPVWLFDNEHVLERISELEKTQKAYIKAWDLRTKIQQDMEEEIAELEKKLETYSHFINEHQMVLDNQERLSGEIAELREEQKKGWKDYQFLQGTQIKRQDYLEERISELEKKLEAPINVLGLSERLYRLKNDTEERISELKEEFECHFRADADYDLKYQKQLTELRERLLKSEHRIEYDTMAISWGEKLENQLNELKSKPPEPCKLCEKGIPHSSLTSYKNWHNEPRENDIGEVWNPIALKNELISEFLKDLKKIRPIYPSYVSELIEKWEEKLK